MMKKTKQRKTGKQFKDFLMFIGSDHSLVVHNADIQQSTLAAETDAKLQINLQTDPNS